uniref:Cyclin C-terminal domain-containing protein n=1 Tax=Timema tahoe TaxID=61484 RepID=A0A7R9FIS9_9NEOP|nr:unnamed protein product [Timema tahoe]
MLGIEPWNLASPEQHAMAKYLMELCLVEYDMCHYAPSMIAAAALYLSLSIINNPCMKPVWTKSIQHYSRYNVGEVKPVAQKMAAVIKKLDSSKLERIRALFDEVAVEDLFDSEDKEEDDNVEQSDYDTDSEQEPDDDCSVAKQGKLTMDPTSRAEAASDSGVLTRSMVYSLNKEGLILELGKRGLQCSLDTTVVRLQAILLGILTEGEASDDPEGVGLVDRQAVPVRAEATIDLSHTLGTLLSESESLVANVPIVVTN